MICGRVLAVVDCLGFVSLLSPGACEDCFHGGQRVNGAIQSHRTIRNLGLSILGITCPAMLRCLAAASITHGRRCWPRSTTPALSRRSFENSRPQMRQLSHNCIATGFVAACICCRDLQRGALVGFDSISVPLRQFVRLSVR